MEKIICQNCGTEINPETGENILTAETVAYNKKVGAARDVESEKIELIKEINLLKGENADLKQKLTPPLDNREKGFFERLLS